MKWFVGSYSCVKALNLRFTCQNIVRGDFLPLLCVKRREDIFLLRLKEHLFWFRTSQSIGQQTHKALYITQMNLHYSLQTVHHFFIQNLFSNIITNIQYNFVYHLVHNINKDQPLLYLVVFFRFIFFNYFLWESIFSQSCQMHIIEELRSKHRDITIEFLYPLGLPNCCSLLRVLLRLLSKRAHVSNHFGI